MANEVLRHFNKICTTINKRSKEKDSVLFNKFNIIFFTKSWGRSGIQFKRDEKQPNARWNPAFFAGLVLDPKDHSYDNLFDKGTILSLIVDIGEYYWDKLYHSSEWEAFSEKLKDLAIAKGWLFYNIFDSKEKGNQWHPLVAYRPIFDMLCEANEQANGKEVNLTQFMEEKILELIELPLQTEEYKKLTAYLDNIDRQAVQDNAVNK